jgi:hypothetical protein
VRAVALLILAPLFRFGAVRCKVKHFTERFANWTISCFARRTARLDGHLDHRGLALRGRPAACFAAIVCSSNPIHSVQSAQRRRGQAKNTFDVFELSEQVPDHLLAQLAAHVASRAIYNKEHVRELLRIVGFGGLAKTVGQQRARGLTMRLFEQPDVNLV